MHYFRCVTYIIVLVSCLVWQSGNAQAWHNVGNAGFSAGAANYTSLVLDSNGLPYVAYQDAANANKLTVMHYDGNAWLTVGEAGFSTATVYYISIAISGTGIPYVSFQDAGNSDKVTVMKYNGTAWVNVGSPGFTAAQAYYVSLALDANGTPYVAYQDYGDSAKASVMKFDGAEWVQVGAQGFSLGQAAYTNIAINSQGVPYVVYEDFATGNRATVMKYDGTAWVSVGVAGFSANAANYTTIAIDKNDTPYAAFNESGANVFRFNGSSWVQVGLPSFTNQEAYTSMAIADTGVLYVAGANLSFSSRAFVSVYDSTAFHTWTSLGGSVSTDAVIYTSLALDKHGVPFLAYSDEHNGYKASVMTFSVLPGIVEEARTVDEVKVYPNPSEGSITIVSAKGGEFKLLNMLGQIVSIVNVETNIPKAMDGLPQGLFVIIADNSVTKLIVK